MPRKAKTAKAHKILKTKTKTKPKSKKIPMPSCWKDMKKVDKKIIKLTKELKKTMEVGLETIEANLKTERDVCYKEDLKDYFKWIEGLNSEMQRYKDYGKDRFI